jgi:release factor glutamine methyltransferase
VDIFSHNVQAALAASASQLEDAGLPMARLDAALLMAHALGISREQLAISPEKILNSEQIELFSLFVARRAQYEPIAYITGEKEFWSLDFYVTRDTLIPRPDSETIVEAALKKAPDRAKPATLLDIGTGTGCLLVALLKELPNARGTGLDNNKGALQVAQRNAERHGVSSRAMFLESHWCDAIDGTFDLIVSNPPYIAETALTEVMPDVARYEPMAALVAGEGGLDAYRALSPQVARRLNLGGTALFEVGRGQAEAVAELLEAQGLEVKAPVKDLAGIARCVVATKQ